VPLREGELNNYCQNYKLVGANAFDRYILLPTSRTILPVCLETTGNVPPMVIVKSAMFSF